ncbi:MAG: hypothetical protein AB1480_11675 [Nitrospirota bacterium]
MVKKIILGVLLIGILLGGLWFYCNYVYSVPIKTIIENPRMYEGKNLIISGKVVDRVSLIFLKYFRLQDKTSEIMETWFNNAYVRKDFNRDIIEDSISWLYSISGLKKPEILYASSPLQCQSIASMINQIEPTDPGRSIRYAIGKEFNSAPLLSDLVDRKICERVCDQLSLVWEGVYLIEEHLRRRLKSKYENFSRDGIAAFQWCSYHEFFEA